MANKAEAAVHYLSTRKARDERVVEAEVSERLHRLFSEGYEQMIHDRHATRTNITAAIMEQSALNEKEATACLTLVLTGLTRAAWRADWRLGRGKVRPDATIPLVAISVIHRAIDILAHPFSDEGVRSYRNRQSDFIEALAEFALSAAGRNDHNEDFYCELGKWVAMTVLNHAPPTPQPLLCPDASVYAKIMDAAKEQVVYFVRAGAEGPIKIGIAANPLDRLATLQTGHHEELRLLAVTVGGGERERLYHAQFREHRLRGEWFSPHPDILAEIERLNAFSPTPKTEGCDG